MNYSYNQAGGVVSTAEEMMVHVAIREAKKAGHKFIELYYNQELIQDAELQAEVRINGVQAVRVYESRDKQNRRTYDVVVKGGQLIFRLDEEIGEWVGEMLDDKTEGLYGEIGYNRDILASHYETGEFIIKDKRIEREVKSRLEKIKKIRHQKDVERVAKDTSILPSLEEEKKRLEEKIEKAREQQQVAKSGSMPSLTAFKKNETPGMKVVEKKDAEHATSS